MKSDFALIFDMDGVLVDNFKYHQKAWKMFCSEHGLDFDRAFRSRVFGGTNKDHLETFFGRPLDPNEVRTFEAQKEALYRTLYAPYICPVPGVLDFLEEIKRKGIPCALATSSPSENVHFVLEKTQTRGYFPVVCDASSITRGKPYPDIFVEAASRLGMSPDRCIVFEDSLNGIEAAKRSGARVVALLTTHPSTELPEVDRVIENFENLELRSLQNLL